MMPSTTSHVHQPKAGPAVAAAVSSPATCPCYEALGLADNIPVPPGVVVPFMLSDFAGGFSFLSSTGVRSDSAAIVVSVHVAWTTGGNDGMRLVALTTGLGTVSDVRGVHGIIGLSGSGIADGQGISQVANLADPNQAWTGTLYQETDAVVELGASIFLSEHSLCCSPVPVE